MLDARLHRSARLACLCAAILLVWSFALNNRSAFASGFDFAPDDRFGHTLSRWWAGSQVRASGWLRPMHRPLRATHRIVDAWIVASARSGWSLPTIEEYVGTLAQAYARCDIELAPLPLVLLASFPP